LPFYKPFPFSSPPCGAQPVTCSDAIAQQGLQREIVLRGVGAIM
jgi:hypothetical protein